MAGSIADTDRMDLHHIGKPDPDPHQSEKLDLDPDPHA